MSFWIYAYEDKLKIHKIFFLIIAGIDRILTGNSSTRSESLPPTPNIKPLDLSGLEVPEGLYIIEISNLYKISYFYFLYLKIVCKNNFKKSRIICFHHNFLLSISVVLAVFIWNRTYISCFICVNQSANSADFLKL